MLSNCAAGQDSWVSLDSKEIEPVNSKGNQPWIVSGIDAEAPIFWLPDAKSWIIGEDPAAGKDWGQEETGMTEDEMAGWHYQLNGWVWANSRKYSEGQESLACCNPWGCKDLVDRTYGLNTKNNTKSHRCGEGAREHMRGRRVGHADRGALTCTPPRVKPTASGKLPDTGHWAWGSVKIRTGGVVRVGDSRQSGYMYTYSWLTVLYSSN